MTQPLPDNAIRRRHEPLCRKRHDEYPRGADRSAEHDDPVRRELLRQRAYDRRQDDDDDCVDRGNLSNRRVQAEFANAELRKHIIHLQKNGLQKSNEEKEKEQPVKTGLTDQPPEKMRGVDRALAHRLSDTAPKCVSFAISFGRRRRICVSAQEIDHRKQHDLENQADDEELLVASGFEAKDADVQIQLAHVIEYPARGEISDVHHRVDNGERHRPLRDG